LSTASKEYDVVLFGAGGFVGAQTVDYFARRAPSGLRWAIASSSLERLGAAQARAGIGSQVEALVVDGRDPTAVDALAARARVVLSSAGPFAVYSDELVTACVRRRTHYVDITGETTWVKSLVDRHHATAAREGTRIVPCCGFDSVPSDLGVFLAVQRLRQGASLPCRRALTYFRMSGGLNGGTATTVTRLYDTGQGALARDPFLLGGGPGPSSSVEAHRDPTAVTFDADAGAWIGPFVMGAVNTRVVRRSASLYAEWGQPYGPDFAYQEYAKYQGRFARARALLTSSGLAVFDAAMRGRGSRRVVRALLPQAGAGPSEKSMDAGWFRCEVIASGDAGRTARVGMFHQGDPSNRATVRFVCESALCLALDAALLPGGSGRGGVLTPATAFGDVLADRLRRSGMTID
jgi:short subunit dehydrogenase-like uncharacterized protein